MNELRYNQICNLLEGNINPASLDDLNKWLDVHPDNRTYFEQVKFIWENGAIMPPLKDIKPIHEDEKQIEAALKKVKKQFKQEAIIKPIRRKLFLKIAATAAIFLVLGYFTFDFWNDKNNSFIQITTLQNEEKEVTLPDGSTVWLNPNSKLIYPKRFNKKERKVQVVGTVVFEVTHKNNQIFVVESVDLNITVLGTKFIVKSSEGNEQAQVGVINGKVKVATKDETRQVVLEKGMATNFDETQNKLSENTSFKFSQVFNLTNELVFNNVRLEEVIVELEKAYGVEIELENQAMKSCRFKGTFKDINIDQVLNVLQAVYDYKLESTTSKKYKILEGLCN